MQNIINEFKDDFGVDRIDVRGHSVQKGEECYVSSSLTSALLQGATNIREGWIMR